MSSEDLRNALIALAIQKKTDQFKQKLNAQINSTFQNWEKVLYNYVNVLTQLNSLTKLAEQQKTISTIRQALKECGEMIKSSTEQFDHIVNLVETLLPVSTMNQGWMDSIIKHNDHLSEIKEKLSPLLLFSSNRDIIEMVQKMLKQVNDVQTKINILTLKVHEAVGKGIKMGSNQFNNLLSMENANEEVHDSYEEEDAEN